MTNSYGWYVIYVKSRHEKKVQDELKRNGIESFLPLVSTERQWNDSIKIVHTPLFPGYVFVNIKSDFEFHNVLTLERVHSYIRFVNEYGRVTEKEMTQIRLLVEGTGIEDIEINTELPNIGNKLKIEHGELAGLECQVYRKDNKKKVSVWIDSINQNISATIPLHYFQKNIASYLQL